MIDTSDELEQSRNLAYLLLQMYEPSSVIDIGCNTGLYLSPFFVRRLNVLGIDNDKDALAMATVPVLNCDITGNIPIHKKYDIAMCLEVLEHIPKDKENNVIRNICELSDKIIFSAAQPGAGGNGHINCCTKDHWEKLFNNNGYEISHCETEFIINRMKNLPGTMGWLVSNLMVFRPRRCYPIAPKKPFITDVTGVITSCGRFDLLKQSLDSFEHRNNMRIIIKDDSNDKYQHDLLLSHYANKYEVIIYGWNKGQARCLDSLYCMVETPYIWHMEDDWEFIKEGSLEMSRDILKANPDITIVQLDKRNEYLDHGAIGEDCGAYYTYKPWKLSDNHLPWYGWCGSPHLMRKSDWEKVGRFSSCSTEKQYDSRYANAGMKTVWAKDCYVKHIGYGRSKAKGHTTWL